MGSGINWEFYGIPPEFFGANLNDLKKFNDSDLIERVTRFFESRPPMGLTLMGSNGCGKSHTVCAILKACKMGYGLSIYRNTLQGMINDYTENDWRLPRKYYDVHILAIEELGKELRMKHDLATPILEDLLKYRTERNKRNIFTTNIVLSDMEIASGKDMFTHFYGATVQNMIKNYTISLGFRVRDFREDKKIFLGGKL